MRTAAIWLISLAAVLIVAWFVPSLANASLNMLFRLRGEFPPSENIVIVAIDDASLQRVGKYPWTRRITAECLDKITAGKPQAVGIDVVYAEETELEDDEIFAESIRKNGRTVLPVQLYENIGVNGRTQIDWLNPLPELAQSAAAEGHAHAAPDVDGTLRSVQLSKSDDKGTRFWAFGLEILRVAENIRPEDYEEKPDTLRFGDYNIRLFPDETAKNETTGIQLIRPNEMLINYVGATKSFKYYSFADVLDGTVAPETFNGKIVLIGATSPTLGDSQVTPFMHYAASDEQAGGQAMPGVEVHANIINTIKSRLWLGFVPQFVEIGLAFLIIICATAAVKFFDSWRQVISLVVLVVGIIAGCLFAFNNLHLILPLPELMTAFFVSVPFLLVDRSLAASRDLDVKISLLSEVQRDFLLDADEKDGKTQARALIVPRNLEWKLRAVDDITGRLLSRLSFINRVLTGMEEGVIVADTNCKTVLINESLAKMFAVDAKKALGRNLKEFFLEIHILTEDEAEQVFARILRGENYEKEYEDQNNCHYFLRFSPVVATDDAHSVELNPTKSDSEVIGILVLISDVTKQRELDRLKAETVQLVSHELRAPLTSIQGLSDVLRKFPVSGEESQEMLATIHSEAVRLNDLINRFLDVKRLESGAQDLQLSDFDVQQMIAGTVSAARLSATEKNIEIKIDEDSKPLVISADAQLLAQTLGNLLSNAIKYSPLNTMIGVAAERIENEIILSVADQGYGIPNEALNRIFDNFYRLKRDTDAGIVGTGLGLSFVKEIAERHGGRVTVENREKSGAIFRIYLPV